MAVEIVDEKPDPKVVKNIICGNCGVKLSYVPNDVKVRRGHDWSGGEEKALEKLEDRTFTPAPAPTKPVLAPNTLMSEGSMKMETKPAPKTDD